MAKSLWVTLVRSGINSQEMQKWTIKGLGLSKLGVAVTLPDNSSVRGMIRAVSHLIRVERTE